MQSNGWVWLDKDGYTDLMRMTSNTLKATFAASRRVGLDRVGCANQQSQGWRKVLRDLLSCLVFADRAEFRLQLAPCDCRSTRSKDHLEDRVHLGDKP